MPKTAKPSKPLVIGFTGTFGAGKDAAQAILQRYLNAQGLTVENTNTSDELREYCREHDMDTARPVLQKVATMLREQNPAYLAERCITKIKNAKPTAKVGLVGGIRHPGEVARLRKEYGKTFVLIAIDAPIPIRYARTQKRARAHEEKLSFEQFKQSQEKEMQTTGGGQQIGVVMDLADRLIWNNSTLAAFGEDLERVADELVENYQAGRAVLIHGPRVKTKPKK